MYRTHDPFDYAQGFFAVFPPGMEARHKGSGTIVIEKDYTIYFTPDAPESVKQRFIREYAAHHAEVKKQQEAGLFID